MESVVLTELGKGICAVTVQQVVSQRSGVHAATIWKFLGSRFVEAHIHGNAQAQATELVEVSVSSSRSFRSC
jgi:hypothetical protein